MTRRTIPITARNNIASKSHNSMINGLSSFILIHTEKKIVNVINNFSRQALHATKINFSHPIDNRELIFKATKPKDFLKLEQVLFEHQSNFC